MTGSTKSRIMCLAGVLVLSASAMAQGGPPPQRVRFGEVRQEPVAQMRQVTGELRAARRSMVAAEVPGRVVEQVVDEGDTVKAGDVLARLDTTLAEIDVRRLEAERDAHQARVQERQAMVSQEQRDLERLQDAVRSGGVNASEVEDAQIALSAAKAIVAQASADLASAEAALSWAREQIDKMTVRAPFSGRIVAKGSELGQWVGEGDMVVELVELDVIDAWIDVPERFIGALSSSVTVEIAALSESLTSESIVIIDAGDPLARTFPVRIRLQNDSGNLRPAMSVVASIPTGVGAVATTVPKDAVLRDDAGTFVYFDAGGVAAPMRVARRWAFGDRVVVDAARLAPGMRLVIEGNERIFPGQPLIDIDATAPVPGGGE
jgi:RND family efflux transporter MFP subunit